MTVFIQRQPAARTQNPNHATQVEVRTEIFSLVHARLLRISESGVSDEAKQQQVVAALSGMCDAVALAVFSTTEIGPRRNLAAAACAEAVMNASLALDAAAARKMDA